MVKLFEHKNAVKVWIQPLGRGITTSMGVYNWQYLSLKQVD